MGGMGGVAGGTAGRMGRSGSSGSVGPPSERAERFDRERAGGGDPGLERSKSRTRRGDAASAGAGASVGAGAGAGSGLPPGVLLAAGPSSGINGTTSRSGYIRNPDTGMFERVDAGAGGVPMQASSSATSLASMGSGAGRSRDDVRLAGAAGGGMGGGSAPGSAGPASGRQTPETARSRRDLLQQQAQGLPPSGSSSSLSSGASAGSGIASISRGSTRRPSADRDRSTDRVGAERRADGYAARSGSIREDREYAPPSMPTSENITRRSPPPPARTAASGAGYTTPVGSSSEPRGGPGDRSYDRRDMERGAPGYTAPRKNSNSRAATPNAGSFDDMLKDLDDIHTRTSLNPPARDPNASGSASAAASVSRRVAATADLDGQPAIERPASPNAGRDRAARIAAAGSTRVRTERATERDVRSPTPTRGDPAATRTPRAGAVAGDREAATTPPRPRRGLDDGTGVRTPPRGESSEEAVMNEKERKEMELQRQDLERLRVEQRRADRMEAERVAAEREKRIMADRERRGSESRDFALLARGPVNEAVLVADYIRAVITTLRADTTITPVPEDFLEIEAYPSWRQNMDGLSFQRVLERLLKLRFLKRPDRNQAAAPAVKLFFKIVEARGLVAKEGRLRDAYCSIEFGDLDRPDRKKDKNAPVEVFQTETVPGSLDPVWNQHLNMDVKNLTDKIQIEVWDRSKDQFLGLARININEIITRSAREGYITQWLRLEPRDPKYKDKYVGGDLLIEATVDNDDANRRGGSDRPETFEQFQAELNSQRVNNKSLYKTLLRACLALDLHTPREGRGDVLSEESATLLRIMSRAWGVGEAVQVMLFLEILLSKYKSEEVPVSEILKTFEILFANMKRDGWMPPMEDRNLVALLEDMQEHFRNQVTKYKEFFPKNRPASGLETCILIMRMIQKSPSYRRAHPDLHDSFREELRKMLTEALITRFQRFRELTTPFDEGDVESVVEGVNKLAEMVSDEIEMDNKYFQAAFAIELDIVRLTAESHLKYFVLTLEDMSDLLASENAVNSAAKLVFSLYKRVKLMDERYAKLVPGLKRLSSNAGFNAERWFSPFMTRWLEKLSDKTIDWVTNAVKADSFEPIEIVSEDGVPPHSSSVTDVFSAVYSELEFITDLGWSDAMENAAFFQAFARTVNKAIEQYCDAIAIGELKPTATPATTAASVAAMAQNLLASRTSAPKDIQNESCVKLRNIEYAMTKLREMYRMMNVAAITKTVKDHRKSIMPVARVSPKDGGPDLEDKLTGAFKIQVAFAENVKPVYKNGLSNPYLVIRVPDGTVVPPPEQPDTPRKMSPRSKTPGGDDVDSKPVPPTPTILNGAACELLRSRVIQDSVNPTWDETFQIILPPVNRLEVGILSRNLLTSDEPVGRAAIDFSVGTRLRRKLTDNQTHDVYVELEPQGRVLLRLTMEGEQEDVDFWFRRTNERLIRTRDDFLRSLTAKITPYTKDVIAKAIKDNEAAQVKSTFFSALTAPTQYSDKTAAGVSIDKPITEPEADTALLPLTDYLNKNLETLCASLSPPMAQEVIKRAWEEAIVVVEGLLIPPLYGQIEAGRRVLNRRQVTMAEWALRIIRDFFHADGQGLGLSIKVLDTRKYLELVGLMACYHDDLPALRREYELSLQGGRDKEMVLRVVRFRAEKSDDGTAATREEGRAWVEAQIAKRREQARR
ncbi:hypothetical protein BC831DRAFT_451831 [Entophlyctis helioformis]|nr:hypothetical protein BC831DRAFT_451831 [Entophlyctis helioformis]